MDFRPHLKLAPVLNFWTLIWWLYSNRDLPVVKMWWHLWIWYLMLWIWLIGRSIVCCVWITHFWWVQWILERRLDVKCRIGCWSFFHLCLLAYGHVLHCLALLPAPDLGITPLGLLHCHASLSKPENQGSYVSSSSAILGCPLEQYFHGDHSLADRLDQKVYTAWTYSQRTCC